MGTEEISQRFFKTNEMETVIFEGIVTSRKIYRCLAIMQLIPCKKQEEMVGGDVGKEGRR